jgi:hypothetical protein
MLSSSHRTPPESGCVVYLTEEAMGWHVAVEGFMPRQATTTLGRFFTAQDARQVAIDTATRRGCGIIIQARGTGVEWVSAEDIRNADDHR